MTDSPVGTGEKRVGQKRPYYRPTTVGQRRLLFTVYEETGSVPAAAAAAHVGKSTLYYWRKRFEVGGYEALEQVGSHRPHSNPRQLAAEIVEEVKTAKREHPEWGKQRIANQLRQRHEWHKVVSASEVRRILIEAGLWSKVVQAPKGEARPATPRSRSRQ